MAEIITFFGPKARPSRATAKNIVEVWALKALLLSTMAGWRGAPAPLRLAATHVLSKLFNGGTTDRERTLALMALLDASEWDDPKKVRLTFAAAVGHAHMINEENKRES